MAQLFVESFDGYGGNEAMASLWNSFGAALSATGARTGTYCMTGNGASWRAFTSASDTFIQGFHYYYPAGYAQAPFWQLLQGLGTANQVGLNVLSTGSVTLSRNATVIDTSAAGSLVANSWNHIELKVKLGTGTSGTYNLKINGASVFSSSGANTQGQGTPTAQSVHWQNGANKVDNIFLLDATGTYLNDMIGEHIVECLRPGLGNGTNTGWTPSTGTDRGAMVDDVAPIDEDSTYNSATTIGLDDTYNFDNLSGTGTVRSVQLTARMKKADTALKQAALLVLENSTKSAGTTRTMSSGSYSDFQQIFEKRPSDNGSWVLADVNGGEFGVRVIT